MHPSCMMVMKRVKQEAENVGETLHPGSHARHASKRCSSRRCRRAHASCSATIFVDPFFGVGDSLVMLDALQPHGIGQHAQLCALAPVVGALVAVVAHHGGGRA